MPLSEENGLASPGPADSAVLTNSRATQPCSTTDDATGKSELLWLSSVALGQMVMASSSPETADFIPGHERSPEHVALFSVICNVFGGLCMTGQAGKSYDKVPKTYSSTEYGN
ncbi:hypothetical protein NQ176_g8207 [Zarea fungicola]|uniref:Uncharacterized protein n=1 Tax=Zarea fungicola TaxID=93591 RepID=A0ACC1MTS0_9HYPO|nr:hypothetical protein NQ176_g8207 [Lecanicillium fungicola]